MSLFNPPDVPDPSVAAAQGAATAASQQKYNTEAGQQSQAGSMVNQYNPYGSLTYAQTGTGPGGVPMWSANMQLTPAQQQMFNLLQGTKTTAGQQGKALIEGANYGSAQPQDVIGGLTSGLTGDLVNKQMEYYKPFFNTERDQLDTKLKNQGLLPGSPAYDNAMRALDTNHGLVMSKSAAEFQNQAFGQASQLYNMPWMLGKDMAGFGAPGDVKSELVDTPKLNIQPANLIGATAQANEMAMKQYEAEAEKYSSMMSGVAGIGSAALGGWAKAGFPGAEGAGTSGWNAATNNFMGPGSFIPSDEKLKEDISPIGALFDRTPVYSYRYKGDDTPRIGLMAQDVEKDTPEAVADLGGFKGVDYGKATQRSRDMVTALRGA